MSPTLVIYLDEFVLNHNSIYTQVQSRGTYICKMYYLVPSLAGSANFARERSRWYIVRFCVSVTAFWLFSRPAKAAIARCKRVTVVVFQ